MTRPSNGVVRWIAGGLASIVLAGTIAWLGHVNVALGKVAEHAAENHADLRGLQERTRAQNEEIIRRLERIEKKLP